MRRLWILKTRCEWYIYHDSVCSMWGMGVCIGTKPAELFLRNHARGNVSQRHSLTQFWHINLYHPVSNSSVFFRCGWFWCVLVLWVWVGLGFFLGGWGARQGRELLSPLPFPWPLRNCFRGCSQTISFLVLVQPQILNACNHRDIGIANMGMTVES